MRQFRLIAQGVDVSAVNAELDAQPELWNANTYRTQDPTSPHRGINDIWLRYRDPAEEQDYRGAYLPRDLEPWHKLPSLHPIVRNLSHVVDARIRGLILLTETPPGQSVKPHIDTGWNAEFYNCKLYLVLQSDPRCLNYCGDDVENFRAGDVWEYPNNILHSVVNEGTVAHRNLIICFKVGE